MESEKLYLPIVLPVILTTLKYDAIFFAVSAQNPQCVLTHQVKMRTVNVYGSVIPVLVSWMLLTEHKVGGYTSTYIMLEGDCPGPSILFVDDSVQVSLISNPLRYNSRARKRCSLRFQAQKPGHHLFLHWDALRLAPEIGTMDTKVFLRGGWQVGTHDAGQTDDQRQDYMSSEDQITLYYIGFPHFDYFKVTVTEVRYSRLCTQQSEFLCRRRPDDFCINERLLCNGENNCGDVNASDENLPICMKSSVTTTSPTEPPLPVGLVGALAAQPFIIAFLITAFCIINKRRQRARREAEAGSDLQRRAAPSTRLRSQNEYVTLPKSISCTQQKEHPDLSTLQILPTQSQQARQPLPPRRMLPPTPEEPEPNYINLHEAPQLPLLFQVPDINSMPLFHTTGLRKSQVQSRYPATNRSMEPEVSISEPGYVEIDDMGLQDRKEVPPDLKSAASTTSKEL